MIDRDNYAFKKLPIETKRHFMKHLKQSGYYALFRASLGAELNRYCSNLPRRDKIDTLLNAFIMYHVRNRKQVVDTLGVVKLTISNALELYSAVVSNNFTYFIYLYDIILDCYLFTINSKTIRK